VPPIGVVEKMHVSGISPFAIDSNLGHTAEKILNHTKINNKTL